MDQNELNARLAASPSPDRITPEYLKSRIADVGFRRLTPTMTICVIALDNGFQVVGTSACADEANYNKEIGEKIARDNAERQIWPLLGFMLREVMHARECWRNVRDRAAVDPRNDPKPPTLGDGFRRYKSHKVVDAAVIRAAEFNADGSGKVAIRNAAGGPEIVEVPRSFTRAGAVPAEGDILVRYLPDGYLSWSPRDKFEAGYTDA